MSGKRCFLTLTGLLAWICTTTTPTGVRAEASLTPSAAMQQILQNHFIQGQDCGEWPLSPADVKWFQKDFDGSTVPPVWKVCPHRLEVFSEGSRQKAYLLLESRPKGPQEDTCHPCSPWLGAAIFEKKPTGWQLIQQSRILSHGPGSYGQLAESKGVALGSERHGFMFEPGYTNMGATIIRQELYAEVNQRLVKVWEAGTASDNAGMVHSIVPKYDYASKIQFVSTPGQDWPELHQIVTGTALKEVSKDHYKAVSVAGTRIYRFDGKVYRPVQKYFEL